VKNVRRENKNKQATK